MSRWQAHLEADPLPWLLEPDNPSVRRFALTDLLDRPASDPEVHAAAAAIMDSAPVRAILDAQYPDGYWVKPGLGYSPKYKATVWQILFLAELGAGRTERIAKACEHVFAHTQREDGRFIANRGRGGAIVCLNGNLMRSLLWFGYGDDERVERGFGWLAERITGERGFRCPYNGDQPCAWGAVKALLAFAAQPPQGRTPAVQAAIRRGVDFLLSRDLAVADYPHTSGISPLWFRFGFPTTYASHVLEALLALSRLGCGGDRRLANAVELVLSKQDERGRWPLESTVDKAWTRFEKRGQPSKWVTLNVLRVLKAASRRSGDRQKTGVG